MAGREHEDSVAKGGLAGLGVAAFAVACCAAFPIAVSLASGVAIGTLVGVGAGVVPLAATIVLVVWLRRRRAARCAPPVGKRGDASGRSEEIARTTV